MAGRKRKPDAERFEELSALIQKIEQLIASWQARLDKYKTEQIEILSHLIIGQMEVRHLNYPEVESLLTQLFKHKPSDKQLIALKEQSLSEEPTTVQDLDLISELKVRVALKEKQQIYANMKKAHYSSFNSYAKKLLLDGYLILWSSPETRELKKELGAINRSLNQLVKRANATGSIYAGDFQDILDCWKEIQAKTLHYIDQMNRKGNGVH